MAGLINNIAALTRTGAFLISVADGFYPPRRGAGALLGLLWAFAHLPPWASPAGY